MEIISEAEYKFHAELGRLAGKHMGGDLGLELLPFDPTDRPDQRLEATHHKPSPEASLDTIRTYAGIALRNDETGRLDELVGAFQERRDLMNHLSYDLADGKKIALVSDHSQLHGIAVLQAAEILALDNPDNIPRSAIVMSKLITRLAVFGSLPATDVLSHLGTSYFSVPRTKSILHSSIDNELATVANQHMLGDLQKRLREGGLLVAVAPSGSIDEREIKHGELRSLTMQRMSSGTAKLIANMDRVLPTALWLDAPAGKPWYWIGEMKDQVQGNPAVAHDIMDEIADNMGALARVPVSYSTERLHGVELARDASEKVVRQVGKAVEVFNRRREERRKRLL